MRKRKARENQVWTQDKREEKKREREPREVRVREKGEKVEVK